LVEMPVDMSLECSVGAETLAAAVHDAPERLVTAVRERMPLQPRLRARLAGKHFAADPQADVVFSARLRYHMLCLQKKSGHLQVGLEESIGRAVTGKRG
jgi:hypothetical protein